jgi:hypothetical protein
MDFTGGFSNWNPNKVKFLHFVDQVRNLSLELNLNLLACQGWERDLNPGRAVDPNVFDHCFSTLGRFLDI